MRYILDGHDFVNEIQTITQVFFPNEKFTRAESIDGEGLTVVSKLRGGECESEIYVDGESVRKAAQSAVNSPPPEGDFPPVKENPGAPGWSHSAAELVKLSMYLALSNFTGYASPWGILTGIRPTKIVHTLWNESRTDDEVFREMTGHWLVSPEKVKLCLEVARAEREIVERRYENDFSLYIGIPFCPSRCLYCSFTSFPLTKFGGQTENYLAALRKEMDFAAKYAVGKNLRTIYVGGGTPTSLNEYELETLLSDIAERFSIANLKEYTVEAGRADTITKEKMLLLKRYGVSRVSVNPQTMNDVTLRRIGRAHTAEQFREAFFIAREAGFDNINTDIILGLPGETPADVAYTMDELAKLSPENITVHTLAVKRASKLKEEINSPPVEGWRGAPGWFLKQALSIAEQKARALNMTPYYMYRQKNMLGNFENVGYAKPGFVGVYNVEIMEEVQSILALGAGAVTKTVEPRTGLIERVFNVKELGEYISRIDEMIERKGRLL